MYSKARFARVLKQILWDLEQGKKVSPDDPDLLEIERILLRRIAALRAEPDPPQHSTEDPIVQPD